MKKKQVKKVSKLPAGGSRSEKELRTHEVTLPFSFVPPVGILEETRQFTRDGWEKVKK
jgi:hypothetical protein